MAQNWETASSPPIPPTMLPRENIPAPPPLPGALWSRRGKIISRSSSSSLVRSGGKGPPAPETRCPRGSRVAGKRPGEGAGPRGRGRSGAWPRRHLQLSSEFAHGALVTISLLLTLRAPQTVQIAMPPRQTRPARAAASRRVARGQPPPAAASVPRLCVLRGVERVKSRPESHAFCSSGALRTPTPDTSTPSLMRTPVRRL